MDEIATIEEAILRTQHVLKTALRSENIRAGTTTERDLERTIKQLVEKGGDVVEFCSINVGPTRERIGKSFWNRRPMRTERLEP